MIGGRYGGWGNALQGLRQQQQPYTGRMPTRQDYLNQAAQVDAKSRRMGVDSPIRYNSGTKYGFGL